MNSKFVVSDLSGYSPLDIGTPSYLRVPHANAPSTSNGATSSTGSSGAKKAQEVLRIFVEPRVSKA